MRLPAHRRWILCQEVSRATDRVVRIANRSGWWTGVLSNLTVSEHAPCELVCIIETTLLPVNGSRTTTCADPALAAGAQTSGATSALVVAAAFANLALAGIVAPIIRAA